MCAFLNHEKIMKLTYESFHTGEGTHYFHNSLALFINPIMNWTLHFSSATVIKIIKIAVNNYLVTINTTFLE